MLKNVRLKLIACLAALCACLIPLGLAACGQTEYLVTFDFNYEGSPAVQSKKTENGQVVYIDDPVRDGYEFSGWYLDADGERPFGGTVSGDTTLYAKWDEAEETVYYSVTYAVNGGTGELPADCTVAAGESLTLPDGAGLSRDGYLFDGWKCGNAVYAAGESVVIDGDMRFTANWTYAVALSFGIGDAAGTAPLQRTVKTGSAVILPDGGGFSLQGYVFYGWLASDGTLYKVGESYTAKSFGESFTAAWSGAYSLTLVGGDGEGQTVSVNTEEPYTLPQGGTVDGKNFICWKDEATGKTYAAGENFIGSYKDVTLTAEYEAQITVTYLDWDGTVLASVGYGEDDEITAPEKLIVYSFCEFTGWDKELSGITASTTVTAQYDYAITDISNFEFTYSARYDGYFIKLSQLPSAKSLSHIAFPASYNGKPVLTIEASTNYTQAVFYNSSSLQSVYIPSSFTSLPSYAFRSCSYLSSVRFAEQCAVTTIGNSAFRDCTSLTEFTIPASVKTVSPLDKYGEAYTTDSIGSSYLFYGSGLVTVTFEEGSSLILSGKMFEGCSSLVNIVNLPQNITVIPFSAFRDCEALASFEVPASVTTIGGWAFDGCDSLGTLAFKGNSVATIGKYAFSGTPITSFAVPENVTQIPEYMLYGCSNLASVTTGNIVSIGGYAFGNCVKLARFNSEEEGKFIMPSTLEVIGAYAFLYATSMKEITLNEGLLEIGDGAFASYYWTDKGIIPVGITQITIPSSVTSIGAYLFEADENLKYITILTDKTDYVTYDGIMYSKSENALVYCPMGYETERLVIPEGTVKIADKAFYNVGTLDTVVFPSTLEAVGEAAFGGSSLRQAELNDGLLTIGNAAFYNTLLSSVVIPASVTFIDAYAFAACTGLTELSFADNSSLTELGGYAFYGIGISSVRIPAKLTVMGEHLFQACKSLATVTFEEGSALAYISESAFNSTGLVSIELPSTVTELRYNCLSYNNLAEIDLSGIVTVGQQVFTSTKLTEVYIPATVETIGVHAFSQNPLLSSVTFDPDCKVTEIGNFAFYQDILLKEIELPASVTAINMGAFASGQDAEILVELDKLVLRSPTVVTLGSSAFGEGAVKVLCVPSHLVNNYANNASWSSVALEIKAIDGGAETTALSTPAKITAVADGTAACLPEEKKFYL